MNLQNQTSELKTLYIEGIGGYSSAKSVIYARSKEGGEMKKLPFSFIVTIKINQENGGICLIKWVGV